MAFPALSPLLFQRQLARFPRCLHRPCRQQWGRWKDGKLNLIAEAQNQQGDSRGWVLPEMGCKAHFLSFGNGFVRGSRRAAGCRSDSTLSSSPDACIRSHNLSLGSGKQQSSWMQVMVPDISAECGAVVAIPCGWAVAVPSGCRARFPAGNSHLLFQNVPSVPEEGPLSFLSASGGVWAGLGRAGLGQQERASTVTRGLFTLLFSVVAKMQYLNP